MLALLSFLSAPNLKEIQVVVFELQLQVCLHPRWPPGRHFDIKNLFDVQNPHSIPDIGVKFQTIRSKHF